MLKSKAAIFISKKQGIIIDDIYLTEPNDTEVIIKNFYTGLCGSILTNLSRDPKSPELLGHEGTGKVISKGKKVKHVNVGDEVLISWMPFNSNTKTNYFQWTNFLYKNQKINSLIYTISEYSKLHCQFVSKLPKNISHKEASILGCAIISGYSPIIKNKDIGPKSNVAIIGAGGLGLLALNAAKNRKVKNITLIENNQNKLNYGKKFGIKNLVNINDKNFYKKINKITDNIGFDYIYDFVGKNDIHEKSLNILKKSIPGFSTGGTLAIIGLGYDKSEFFSKQLLLNEQTIKGIRGGSVRLKKDLPKIYKDLRNKKIKMEIIISKVFDFTRVKFAVNKLKQGKIFGRAVIKIN